MELVQGDCCAALTAMFDVQMVRHKSKRPFPIDFILYFDKIIVLCYFC